MSCYDVKYEGQTVGSVTVSKEGLYYRFSCRCKPRKTALYKLTVFCDGRTTDIGICVPQENGFGLDKQIPVKRVGEGDMKFQLMPRGQSISKRKVPLIPGAPFAYISELEHSHLILNNGNYEICLSTEDH